MRDEAKGLLTCMVYLGREWNIEGLNSPHYWLQSANRAWHLRAPFHHFELEDALLNLPSSVRRLFNPLEPAMSRQSDMWALRLGITEIDEIELDREWISVVVQPVTFREPVDEGDDRVPGLDMPEWTN
jgi:hypothetical protein